MYRIIEQSLYSVELIFFVHRYRIEFDARYQGHQDYVQKTTGWAGGGGGGWRSCGLGVPCSCNLRVGAE